MKLEKVIGFVCGGGVTLIGLGASLPATAAVLVNYQFPSASLIPTNTSPNITANNINNTGSSLGIQPGVAVPNSIFVTPSVTSTTPGAAVANNQYFQFSVTPDANFEIDLTGLTFDASRGGASIPRGWVLRSSLDNFAANIATADIPTVNASLTPFSIDLSGAAFQNITSSAIFRIYAYTPTTAAGIFFDNITLNGTVSSLAPATTPEPSSMVALLSLAAIGGGAFAKRRIGK